MEVRVGFNRRWSVLCLALVLAAGSGFAQTLAAAAPAASTAVAAPETLAKPTTPIREDLNDRHRIRPGDKLSFRVDEDREEAKVLTVHASGEVELPNSFGRFNVANKTCRTVASEIKTALEKDYYNKATVHIGLETANEVAGRCYVYGQVTKPGPVTIPADNALKLSQAILLAGPPTQWAKLSAVQIVRTRNGQKQTMKVDVEKIEKEGRIEDDISIEPDDMIVVPERGILIK